MVSKKRSTKEKLVGETDDEEDENTQKKSLILLTSSDDDEGNEDLSLQIVEKARLREAMRKSDVNGVRSVEGIIDLSSSSCEEIKELGGDNNGVLMNGTEKEIKIKKKMKKKKKLKKKIKDDGENFVGIIDSEEISDIITTSIENEEPIEVVETARVNDVETAVGMVDNVVLRKLLRGPRYFDPPERNCRTCYNCGEEGHNALNCTSKKRKKPCFICGSTEHGVRNCKQGQDCFICKKQGHRAKDCPEKNQVTPQEAKICLRCGDIGHLMFSCSRDYDPDDLKDIQCYICKRYGHLCCVNSIDPGPVEVSCYNCGQSGHTGTGCAKQRGLQRGEVSNSAPATLCYKCGEEGHFARGCTNSSKADRWKGESSTPTRKYSKGKDIMGYQSAPPLPHKKKHKWYEDKNDFASERRPKRKGGWIPDEQEDYPKRKARYNEERDSSSSKRRGGWVTDDSNGWRSPSTPTKRNHKSPARNHTPYSRTPYNYPSPTTPTHHHSPNYGSNNHPNYPMTPNSHGYSNSYQPQVYRSSRFGDHSGHESRGNNYW